MMLLLIDNYKLASKLTGKTRKTKKNKKKKHRIPWVRQSGAYCDFQIRALVLLSYFTASSDYTSPQETH